MYSLISAAIFKSTEQDIVRIIEIQTECNLSEWSEGDYLKELKDENSLILTAKLQDEIIGFLAARLSKGVQTSYQPIRYEDADILNFGVDKKFQDRGIGSLLLKTFLNTTARIGLAAIWLEVRESNVNAINFYKNKGFVKIQTRKNFYRQPLENAILMKLAVKTPSK